MYWDLFYCFIHSAQVDLSARVAQAELRRECREVARLDDEAYCYAGATAMSLLDLGITAARGKATKTDLNILVPVAACSAYIAYSSYQKARELEATLPANTDIYAVLKTLDQRRFNIPAGLTTRAAALTVAQSIRDGSFKKLHAALTLTMFVLWYSEGKRLERLAEKSKRYSTF